MKNSEEIFNELEVARERLLVLLGEKNLTVSLYGSGYQDALMWVLGLEKDDDLDKFLQGDD